MYKIDTSTSSNNQFIDGDVGTQTPATELNAKWFNHVQNELVNLIEGLGGSVDGASQNTILERIINLRTILENRSSALETRATSLEDSRSNRIGEIVTTLSRNPPNDCLPCNGGIYNKVDYPELIQYGLENGLFPSSQSESISIYTTGRWGKLLNLGHLETDVKFRVPNLQEMFLRMAGSNANPLGYYQWDTLQNHNHYVYELSEVSGTNKVFATATTYRSSSNYNASLGIKAIAGGGHSGNFSLETRPQNISVNFWIRYQ